MTRLGLLAALCASTACTQTLPPRVITRTVEVRVPVAVERAAPAALLAPIAHRPPTFIAPTDPAATSALSAEQEGVLRDWIAELIARDRAWRAWARVETPNG